jgi:hypothetical protein
MKNGYLEPKHEITSSLLSQLPSSSPPPSSYNAVIIKTKIGNATEGLPSYCFNRLSKIGLSASKIGEENALAICDYMFSLRSEINPSGHYRKDNIISLFNLSTFFKNAKSFKEITREDLISFLDSYRKSDYADPLHKWIGTYNLYRIHLMRFFKWLYSPDVEPDKKAKATSNRKYTPAKAQRKINLQAN